MNQACCLRLPQSPDLLAIHSAAPDDWPFLLNSLAGGQRLGRWSMLLRQSGEVIVHQSVRAGQAAFLQQLRRAVAVERGPAVEKPASAVPFNGGWFLYLGYELAAEIEPRLNLPAAEDGLPVAYAARCPGAILVDHHQQSAWLVAESQSLLDRMQLEVRALANAPTISQPEPFELVLEHDEPEAFKNGVHRIRDWILAGDVFQVNLSRGWRASSPSRLDPLAILRALARSNPAPFAGLARLPGGTVISSSPERLVSLRDGLVETRPIAGTRPRGATPSQDDDLSSELLAHPKERAEHIMLIDLERNDLGRVCLNGSVEVDELMVVESYAHVHHIVSNVRGQLRPELHPADLIAAVFPGGTITGCPKVRCMEIIAELEGVGRGFYTGSMGYLGLDGRMDLNILIRSMVVSDRQLSFRTGAGIVADSDPAAELAETEAKARGLLKALGAA